MQKGLQKIFLKLLIKNTAVEKREKLGSIILKKLKVATIGDSRTGKSEMAEKMDNILPYESGLI